MFMVCSSYPTLHTPRLHKALHEDTCRRLVTWKLEESVLARIDADRDHILVIQLMLKAHQNLHLERAQNRNYPKKNPNEPPQEQRH